MGGGVGQPVRVVVAGIGAVTAQGPDAKAFWEGVRDGKVAIRDVRKLSMEGIGTRMAGEVQGEVKPRHDYSHPADYRDPVIDFALQAADEAMTGSGLAGKTQVPPERWGVVMATCNGGLLSGQRWYEARVKGETPDPRLAMAVPPQAMAEALSAAHNIKGPVLSIDTACAAGANAIGYAAELIRGGHADAMLTGGSDALSTVLIAGFNSLQSLSPKPAQPYSKNRSGLSLGEGSGMVVWSARTSRRRWDCPSWPRSWATASRPMVITPPRRIRRARAPRGRSARASSWPASSPRTCAT
jgi:3-oxoacyl-[acyl-carrier-protein] synthase II